MNPQKKFHLVFSLIMAAIMVCLMTCVITAVNTGFAPGFLGRWAWAFVVAYVFAAPTIFFLAPVARRMTAALLGQPNTPAQAR